MAFTNRFNSCVEKMKAILRENGLDDKFDVNIFKNKIYTNKKILHKNNYLLQWAENKINKIMDEWIKKYYNDFSGGEMRGSRGSNIETFVYDTINKIAKIYNINLHAKYGKNDKKDLIINLTNGKKIIKQHQVDVHIYLNSVFIAVIECKAYLDSCYYVRACDDFKLFKKFGYNIKNYIFALENSIDKNTKIFTDVITDYICDNVFYVLNGKRSSYKPIYDINHKKKLDKLLLFNFINFICKLVNI
jgi:hypothetical protein